jgi:hypothetical protein
MSRCDKLGACDGDPACSAWIGSEACQSQVPAGLSVPDMIDSWAEEIHENAEWMDDPNIKVAEQMKAYAERMRNAS